MEEWNGNSKPGPDSSGGVTRAAGSSRAVLATRACWLEPGVSRWCPVILGSLPSLSGLPLASISFSKTRDGGQAHAKTFDSRKERRLQHHTSDYAAKKQLKGCRSGAPISFPVRRHKPPTHCRAGPRLGIVSVCGVTICRYGNGLERWWSGRPSRRGHASIDQGARLCGCRYLETKDLDVPLSRHVHHRQTSMTIKTSLC